MPSPSEQTKIVDTKSLSWKYAALGVLLLAAFVGLIKMNTEPKSPAITLVNPVEQVKPVEQAKASSLVKPSLTSSADLSASAGNKEDGHALTPNETIEKTPVIKSKNNLALSVNASKPAVEESAALKSTMKITDSEEHGNLPQEFELSKKAVAENPLPVDNVVKPMEHHAEKSKDVKLKNKISLAGYQR